LDGREPAEVTEYEYGGDGRLLRSTTTREPEWTDLDRDEMLALAMHRDSLCPLCGMPLEVCTSHADTGPEFTVRRRRCRATDERLAAQADSTNTDRPGAVLWLVTQKEAAR
jgi:ferredoxin